MRNLKEILQTILDSIPNHTDPVYKEELNCSGLCWIAWFRLSAADYRRFKLYLREQFPHIEVDYNTVWPEHEIAPRVEWLKQEIEKLSNN